MTRRGVEWLSAAADDPAECRATWADDPRAPYMRLAGRLFEVVTVDPRIGIETFDQLLRRGLPFGPTVLDHKARLRPSAPHKSGLQLLTASGT
ncbi:hypothetical protein [Streptomyces sp. F001]|uniref:hypothetical protein n=1 Tax=Streptomyces sp. F001 TaxID=1510026 RepID=UPI00101E714A|nr:hypothetical protein [Streptomyces sp. F001]RZB16875.1 hypothetical protein StrepF001_23380 [Streptomyces sp. F001]